MTDLLSEMRSFDLYMSANNYSIQTRHLYQWALNLMCSFLANPQLAEITDTDLLRFWGWVRNDYQPKRTNGKTHPLAGRSLEDIWTAERSFFRWAIETKRLIRRPDEIIKHPEYAERIIEPLTLDEVSRLIEAARYTRTAQTKDRRPFKMARRTAKRDAAIIHVLAETGMRVSECARLTWGDVDFDERTIHIAAYGTGRKTKERTIDIGDATRLALWEYRLSRERTLDRKLRNDDLIFWTIRGQPMDRDSIRHVLSEIGNAAGVKSVHPHRFRHFYASEMAADDMSEANLKHNLGQTSDRMTARYIHLHSRKRRTHASLMDKIKQKRRG